MTLERRLKQIPEFDEAKFKSAIDCIEKCCLIVISMAFASYYELVRTSKHDLRDVISAVLPRDIKRHFTQSTV